VVGSFSRTVDFDPGPGEDVRTEPHSYVDDGGGRFDQETVFLTRFAANGDRDWTVTWIGQQPMESYDQGMIGYSLAVASDQSIVVGGSFSGHVDLDPDVGEVIEQRPADGFLLKLRPDRSFAWSMVLEQSTVSSRGSAVVSTLAVDRDGGIVASSPATAPRRLFSWEEAPSSRRGACNVFFVEPNGQLRWAKTWDQEHPTACAADRAGEKTATDPVVVVGGNEPLLWLDPNEGEVLPTRTSGIAGARLSAAGTSVYTTDYFHGVMPDFATLEPDGPEPSWYIEQKRITETENSLHQANGGYVLRITANGQRPWARVWGGPRAVLFYSAGFKLSAFGAGVVIVGDYSQGEVSFDGLNGAPYTVPYRSFPLYRQRDLLGNTNTFVHALDEDGRTRWTRAITGGSSYGWAVAERDGVVAVAGSFAGSASFGGDGQSDVWSSPYAHSCYLLRLPVSP